MRTTMDLDPKAHRLAKAIAAQRHLSLGRLVSEVILDRFCADAQPRTEIGTSEVGLPTFYVGHTITPEEVRELTEED